MDAVGFQRAPKAPALAKDLDKQAKFAAAAGVQPRPGVFPPSFTVEGAQPEAVVQVDLCAGKLAKAIQMSLDEVSEYPRFRAEAARANPRDPAVGADALTRELTKSAVACLMQQVVEGHRSQTGSSGDTSAVYGPKTALPEMYRALWKPVGELNWEEAGIMFRLADYMSTMRRLGRVLDGLDNHELDLAASGYYLPSDATDRGVDGLVGAGVKELLRTKYGLEVDPVVFAANPPPYLERLRTLAGAAALTAEEDAALGWALDGGRPNEIAGGLKNWDSPEFWFLIRLLDPAVPRNVQGQFGAVSKNGFKDAFSAFIESWPSFEPRFGWMSLVSNELLKGVVPSLVQDYDVVVGEDRVSLSGPAGVSMHDLSLAALFPLGWVLGKKEAWTRDARFTVAVNPLLLRRQWFDSFVK